MARVRAEQTEADFPVKFKHWQLDSWWYPKGVGGNGRQPWTALEVGEADARIASSKLPGTSYDELYIADALLQCEIDSFNGDRTICRHWFVWLHALILLEVLRLQTPY